MDNPNDYLCDSCNNPVIVEFHVNSQLWHDVTEAKEPVMGYDGGEGYLCLSCFAGKAASKGIKSFVVEEIFS